MLDTLIYCLPTPWEAIAPTEGENPQSWHYAYKNGITGYWNDFTGGFKVYNVLGAESEIQALLDALEAQQAGSVARVFAWEQGPAVDSLDVWPTDPTDILAVMKDHITYDIDGNPVSSTPATLENPNWGHVFFGQGSRIFAGGFSNGFSAGFK